MVFYFALFSAFIVQVFMFAPFAGSRTSFLNKIVTGKHVAPYQYRILKPFIYKSLNKLVPIKEPIRTLVTSTIVALACFYGIYQLFYMYLPAYQIIGMFLLFLIIPVSITGFWQFGDFINLLFVLVILWAVKIHSIPLLFLSLIGVFNRDQIIYFSLFYLVRYPNEWAVVLFYMLFGFGISYSIMKHYKPEINTASVKKHIKNNTDFSNVMRRILPNWFVYIVPFWILGFVYADSVTLAILGAYTIVFFFMGHMWEFAKYLPVHVILISEIINGYIA